MPRERGGRSQTTVPPRTRKKGPDRKETAYIRAVNLLGEDTVKQIRANWYSWDTKYGGKEWQQSEGVVMQLLQQGLSEREIRAVIPVGGSHAARLRTVRELGVEMWHTRRVQPESRPAETQTWSSEEREEQSETQSTVDPLVL